MLLIEPTRGLGRICTRDSMVIIKSLKTNYHEQQGHCCKRLIRKFVGAGVATGADPGGFVAGGLVAPPPATPKGPTKATTTTMITIAKAITIKAVVCHFRHNSRRFNVFACSSNLSKGSVRFKSWLLEDLLGRLSLQLG